MIVLLILLKPINPKPTKQKKPKDKSYITTTTKRKINSADPSSTVGSKISWTSMFSALSWFHECYSAQYMTPLA